MLRVAIPIVVVTLILSSPSLAQGSGVQASVTTQTTRQTDSGGNVTAFTTTFTVTIQNLPAGENWCDINLPSGPLRFPYLATSLGNQNMNVDVSGGGVTQSWHLRRTYSGLNLYTGTSPSSPPGLTDGTYTFTVPWRVKNNDKTTNKGVNWYLTKDGGANYFKNNKFAAAGETPSPGGGPPSPAPWVPMFSVSANGGTDMKAMVGQGTTLPVDPGEFSDLDYEIYTSLKLNEEGTDPLGLGIEPTTAPVPASWGIQIIHSTGHVGMDGTVSPLPVIEVPADPTLPGKSFYLVFAVKNNDGTTAMASQPITITIVE
ncbi:MAG TPA: hypothetical protein ENK43_05170 [Planctomycetes bacterium]|nr:hypothetical protein [Planctomycetota bacterium]